MEREPHKVSRSFSKTSNDEISIDDITIRSVCNLHSFSKLKGSKSSDDPFSLSMSQLSITSRESRNAEESAPVSPKKSQPAHFIKEESYTSPKKVKEKLPYKVHDEDSLPRYTASPVKNLCISSPKKQFMSPMKYGSPKEFSSPMKGQQPQRLPYVSLNMNYIPYSRDDEDGDDRYVDTRIELLERDASEGSLNSFISSWSTLEPLNPHSSVSRPSLTRSESTASLQSTNSMMSWGELSLCSLRHNSNSDCSALSHHHVPIDVNVYQ